MARRAGLVSVDSRELEQFARRIPVAQRGMRRQLERDIVDGGHLLVAQMKRNAGWSRRIPRTIVLREDKSGRIAGHKATAGVRISVGGPSAPHARVWEPADGRGVISHPVFARKSLPRKKWTWVRMRTKPYARPALEQLRGRIIRNTSDGQLTALKRDLGD